jgi:hypothetical protein
MNLRDELPPLPDRMRSLPVDHRGYPVPYFVAWIDGKPDHPVVDPEKRDSAIRFRRCWLCGEVLGRFGTFVIGPMCAVNRVSSEPPSHRECAQFAARACPFLTRPDARRREAGMPENGVQPAGHMLRRNPGVSLVWTTRSWEIFRDEAGVLWDIGEPAELEWLAEGRAASRGEVLHSIETGMPSLKDLARGADELAKLEAMKESALTLVPRA